jgi:hypothetical protein
MPPRGQDSAQARQRAQRANARALRQGRSVLPRSITSPVRKAQARADLERVFGDLPRSRTDSTRIRDLEGYNVGEVKSRLGKADADNQAQVYDVEYWEDLQYEGEDDDDPFWYH